jgi:hypothetical protein
MLGVYIKRVNAHQAKLWITTKSQTASIVIILCGLCVKIVILESTSAGVSLIFSKKQSVTTWNDIDKHLNMLVLLLKVISLWK